MSTLPGMEERAARTELLHVLMLPHLETAARIGDFCVDSDTRTFVKLLIGLEEDRAAQAVVVRMRERQR